MFVIDDEWHDERIGKYAGREEALAELRRLADLPWDAPPNRCPCTSWRTCGRRYHLIEFDTSGARWRSLSDETLLDVSAAAIAWLPDPAATG